MINQFDIDDLCNICAQEIQEQFFQSDFQQIIQKQDQQEKQQRQSFENYNYSIRQLQMHADSIDFYFKPFDLLIQNQLLVNSQKMEIFFNDFRDNQQNNGLNKDNSYIKIVENGSSFDTKQCLDIITQIDHNQNDIITVYGMNLKLAAMKLGNSFLFISRRDNIVSYVLVSSQLHINFDLDSYNYFFYAQNLDNDYYLTQDSFCNKRNIWDSLKHITRQPIIPQNNQNVLIIFDLKRQPMKRTYDLDLQSIKNDILINFPNIINQTINLPVEINQLVDYSLKTYLMYYFLDPFQQNLKIYLNDELMRQKSYDKLFDSYSQKQLFKNRSERLSEQSIQYQFQLEKFKQLYEECKNDQEKQQKVILLEDDQKESEHIDNEVEDSNQHVLQGLLIYLDNRLVDRYNDSRIGQIIYKIMKKINYRPLPFKYVGLIAINTKQQSKPMVEYYVDTQLTNIIEESIDVYGFIDRLIFNHNDIKSQQIQYKPMSSLSLESQVPLHDEMQKKLKK